MTASVTSKESKEVKRIARLACMVAADNDASDVETGRTTFTIKEIEQREPYSTDYLIRPHIAAFPARIQDPKMVWGFLHHQCLKRPCGAELTCRKINMKHEPRTKHVKNRDSRRQRIKSSRFNILPTRCSHIHGILEPLERAR